MAQGNVHFLVGSPRSGTTILGEILGRHPDIGQWYEPYFIWDRDYADLEDDFRDQSHATSDLTQHIRREFAAVKKALSVSMVIDKTPEHAFRIAYLRAVFPHAKFVHICRDGRDVVVSMEKLANRRAEIVKKRNFIDLFRVAGAMLKRQPTLRAKWLALSYELRTTASLNPFRYLNKSKWKGKVGWGPRFPGWQEHAESQSKLAFHAKQWSECERYIEAGLAEVPADQQYHLSYEDLVSHPAEQVANILSFLEVRDDVATEIVADIRTSSLKTHKNLNSSQLSEIENSAGDMLEARNYTSS